MVEHGESFGVRQLGLQQYLPVWHAMQQFTQQRSPQTQDEVWLLQHYPVFTQGQAGKPEHILCPGDIPVVQVDRGGQVTYHGPGQLVAYLLIDVNRKSFGVLWLVEQIEQAIVGTLDSYGVKAYSRREAPGVYVDGAKIASLGLRIRNGRSFHGLSLNVDMDLEPFRRINPCGYAGMAMTQLCDLVAQPVAIEAVQQRLTDELARRLGYTHHQPLAGGPHIND